MEGNAYKTHIPSKSRSGRQFSLFHTHEVGALAAELHVNRSKIKGGKAKPIRCAHIGLGRYRPYEEHGKTMREERGLKANTSKRRAGPNQTEHAERRSRWLKATRNRRWRFQPQKERCKGKTANPHLSLFTESFPTVSALKCLSKNYLKAA